jgi:uncharacterized iron-regulated membrane protein
MKKLKAVHRTVGMIAMIFLMYLATTGLLIQAVDLRTLFHHSPATDPNTEAMREGFDGAGDYPVIVSTDYLAAALPANADLDAMMQRIVQSARATLGDEPFRYVELRMIDSKPVGQVSTTTSLTSFDGATGQLIQQGPLPRILAGGVTVPSLRNDFKGAHRSLGVLGYIPLVGPYIRKYALYINMVNGLVLIVMIVTGIWTYFKLFNVRRKQGLGSGPFWVAGNWKRTMHRWIGITASLFILIAACSGEWLSYESLYYGQQLAAMRQQNPQPGQAPGDRSANRPQGGPSQANVAPAGATQANHSQPGGQAAEGGFRQSPLTPLKDAEIPWMTQVTLSAARQKTKNAPIRVIRLRNYSYYPQGIVVTGGNDTRQLVFNAATGVPMSESEPGYPPVGFPFGWVAHQTAKSVHRGDFFGLPGRLMDIFAGLSLLYLCVNGIALYAELWWERRKDGKWNPFWM